MLPPPSRAVRLAPPPVSVRGRSEWALGAAVALHVLAIGLLFVRLPALLEPVPPPPARQAEIEMVQNDQAAASDTQPIGGKRDADPGHPAPAATQPPPPASPPPQTLDLPRGTDGEAPPPQPAPPKNAPLQPGPAADAQKQQDVIDKSPPRPQTPDAPSIRLSDGLDDDGLSGGTADTPATPDPRFPNHKPAYPQAAAERGEHGRVQGVVNVNPDGTAGAVIVVNSSGSPTLDTTAVKAWQKWHFKPAVDQQGQPVTSQVPVELDFVLHR